MNEARLDSFLPVIAAASRGTPGYLDWATGLMRLNASHHAWQRVASASNLLALPSRDRELVETVTHETVHFLQIVTTGYLYRFAVTLFNLILECLPRPVRDVSEIPAAPGEQQASRIREHLAALDRADRDGCSIRSIAECQALLAQLRTHWDGITHAAFLQRTDSMPPVYKRAYRLAEVYLGEGAFESYPLLSSMALCCEDPVAALRVLFSAVRDRGLRSPQIETIGRYLELLNLLHARGRLQMMGTAAEVVNELPEHVVYTEMVETLNRVSAEPGAGILAYMAEPHNISERIATTVARPQIYNADTGGELYVHVPSNWHPSLGRDEKNEKVTFLVLIMGFATRILQSGA